MNWQKLSDYKYLSLYRGSLIKFAAAHPFEEQVVMIVCGSPRADRRLGLVTLSGNKAGYNCFTLFPEWAHNRNGSITAGLIYNNWTSWMWPEWSRDSAWILQDGLRVEDLLCNH